MRVLYIYDGAWPRGATRVRKQTLALAEAGHNVLLLARNEERAPRVAHESWMEVRRLPTAPGALANRLLNFPFFLNPLWIRHIYRNARGWADAIVVEDLPLAPTAIWAGRFLGVPVLYDMGEVYPEFLRGLRIFQRPTVIDRIVRDPAAAEHLERYVLRRASHVFVVSDESRDRALERGADAQRTSIVGNTPENPVSLVERQSVPADLAGVNGRPIVLFTGILISDRGILHAIRAIDRVRREVPEVVFIVVGDGPDVPAIEAEINRLQLADHVRLLGWKEHSSLPGYYQNAAIGLLPFLNGGQIRYTLANKLFDYMGAGLPVVASDVPPMRRVVEETRAGVLVRAGDPEALSDGIVELLKKPAAELAAMGQRGRAAVLTTYNWGMDSRRFVAALERVAPTDD